VEPRGELGSRGTRSVATVEVGGTRIQRYSCVNVMRKKKKISRVVKLRSPEKFLWSLGMDGPERPVMITRRIAKKMRKKIL
jgi:hypothetical protein